jgi:hypothetical protein
LTLTLPRPFDPSNARILVAPPGAGRGHWAGAPGAFADGDSLYVVYRLRWPRPRRGGELRIARADARGERLTTIWRATREDLGSQSIERSAIVKERGRWRLYVSHAADIDGRWRIEVIEASSPDAFDPRARRLALGPDMAGATAVKDPWLRRDGDEWSMFISYGERAPDDARLHQSGDALSTGAVKSETGLATSSDGLRWTWRGRIFGAAKSGWDRATTRLTAAVQGRDGWLGFYDGAASIEENYEERCGLARSADLRHWDRLGNAPAVGSAGGPGTVRYVESVAIDGAVRFFFERTRADGAHELCTATGAVLT